ncbi:HET-domain-containing protein [Mytilinidion resinicola]|uniref:HET-domain-containing protein n=1 Tax=Mytilinidion resinicola TaxID=574789 RepID=A0A6A6YN04_9PEZI|nr:HET-domain-containing protein [Mytilinidion resinicola]KAF2809939.1 HET-domain-containing protein [Mytilinidion resinicola]
MRLLDTETLKLHEFFGDNIPPYAILSHRWEDGEVSFQDMQDPHTASQKAGWTKIKRFCEKAARYSYEYAWVDTCCIDKTSSSELSESINSMYQWYSKASYCYAYLSDVRIRDVRTGTKLPWSSGFRDGEPLLSVYHQFAESQWFTRGWTLQELIAPWDVLFYDMEWWTIGTKAELLDPLVEITGVDRRILEGDHPGEVSVAKRMSWASKRMTTRDEDRAYCLLGLFDVNMPLLYGEGRKAFLRLQEEIIKTSDDESLFAWSLRSLVSTDGILAPSPAEFSKSSSIEAIPGHGGHEYSLTNKGLKITLPLIPWDMDVYLALLRCRESNAVTQDSGETSSKIVGIFLRDTKGPTGNRFVRVAVGGDSWISIDPYPMQLTESEERRLPKAEEKTIYVPRRLTYKDIPGLTFMYGFQIQRIYDATILEVYPEERWDSTDGYLTMPPGPQITTGVLLCGNEHAKFTVLLGFREGFQPFVRIQPFACMPFQERETLQGVLDDVPKCAPERRAEMLFGRWKTNSFVATAVITENDLRYEVDIDVSQRRRTG